MNQLMLGFWLEWLNQRLRSNERMVLSEVGDLYFSRKTSIFIESVKIRKKLNYTNPYIGGSRVFYSRDTCIWGH